MRCDFKHLAAVHEAAMRVPNFEPTVLAACRHGDEGDGHGHGEGVGSTSDDVARAPVQREDGVLVGCPLQVLATRLRGIVSAVDDAQ